MSKTHIILGPPGTGKTTKLLSIIDDHLMAGLKSTQVCFVTFTKKAAHEAQVRAIQKFKLTLNELPYFRTLHSLCFGQLSLERKSIMALPNYFDIARILGISISGRGQSDDGTFSGFEKGDRLLFTENLARIRCCSLEEMWEKFPDEDLNLGELQQLRDTLIEYKRINLKLDFTDMVHKFIGEGVVPPIKLLVVDEAQDLSQVQWRMIDKLKAVAETTYIAGDDDQAIYRWAGADIEHWISLPGDTVAVLDRSYRVPLSVAELAQTVIDRIASRRPKMWKSRQEHGRVHYLPGAEQLDLSKGNWLCMARNTYLLKHFEEICTMQGFLYTSPNGNAIRGPAWAAVVCWERLRANKPQAIKAVIDMLDFMTIGVGIQYGHKARMLRLNKDIPSTVLSLDELKTSWGIMTNEIWHIALDKISLEDREYFLAALRNGEKVHQEPRIKISTIHQAKGGEADNVAIITDMAMRTHMEMQQSPDDEARVWYVAITRTRNELYIIQPQTMRHYDL